LRAIRRESWKSGGARCEMRRLFHAIWGGIRVTRRVFRVFRRVFRVFRGIFRGIRRVFCVFRRIFRVIRRIFRRIRGIFCGIRLDISCERADFLGSSLRCADRWDFIGTGCGCGRWRRGAAGRVKDRLKGT
jgi:hypothetical protein